MTTPPKVDGRVVCASGVCLRTFIFLSLFALSATAAPGDHYRQARRLMAEAQQTSNPVRLFMLALDIRKALDAALVESPDDVEVRLDLVRFHVMTPRVAGGDMNEAHAQAEEIFRRAAALGHFARGYIAYREKSFGAGRIQLREAVRLAKTPATRTLALRWLGWLSQESQQWGDAFAIFEELGDLYEVARTASFCRCRLERGRAALQEHLKAHPRDEEAKKLRSRMQ